MNEQEIKLKKSIIFINMRRKRKTTILKREIICGILVLVL